MQCQYGLEYSKGGHKKCRCRITNEGCGFVYFCAPDNCYKNTSGYERCLIRTQKMDKQNQSDEKTK